MSVRCDELFNLGMRLFQYETDARRFVIRTEMSEPHYTPDLPSPSICLTRSLLTCMLAGQFHTKSSIRIVIDR